MNAILEATPTRISIDLGCGKNKRAGFIGVDSFKFEGVDVVLNIGRDQWPWEDNSVDEAHCSHMLEHLTSGIDGERVHFFNELYRVLKPGGTIQIITPSWSNARAYGDPDHKWPPVSEWTYWYVDRNWRKANAPHNDFELTGRGLKCHFNWQVVYTFNTDDVWISGRNAETQAVLLGRNINTAVDLVANLTKPIEESK